MRRSLRKVTALGRDRDFQIALAVGGVTLIILALTASAGFVRDEGYYFRAAQDYHRWFEGLWRNLFDGNLHVSFSDATLRRAFGYNTEHPGFVKILMGWTWKLFHKWLSITDHATGYRLASMILVAVGHAFTYLLGARRFGRPTGLLAVVLLTCCPHVFYHAHLACFDGPMMALTVMATYAFWRSLESPAWVIGAGLVFGVAVATKHNAVFLLPTLLLAYVAATAKDFHLTRGAIALPRLPLGAVTMVLCAPVIFYLFYPYGWHDPVTRIADYYHFHLHHEHYPVDYFGKLYTEPPFPWLFPFSMSAITVPVPILLCGIVGLFACAIRATTDLLRRRAPSNGAADWLILLNTVFPPLLIALPTVPIFGGTKHWMTMMPFFCLLAAHVAWQAGAFARERWGQWAGVALVGAVVLLPAIETVRTHPLGQTYFNEIAGGHQGAAAWGMPRTFWGGDSRGLLETLNAEAAPAAAVFTDRMNLDDFTAYKRDGLLRQDLRWVSTVAQAQWVLINHQREYWDHELKAWMLSGDQRPRAQVAFDGVPIASLYRINGPLD